MTKYAKIQENLLSYVFLNAKS